MRFVTITIFAVIGRLGALATAKPVPNLKGGGMAIPLTRHPSSLNSNRSIDLDAISSHGTLIREKIFSGLDNYERNTGTIHPFAVKQNQSGFGRRGASVTLTTYRTNTWMCEISVGTPPQTLMVHIDTGSADMWVLQDGCNGISEELDLWDPDESDSSDYEGQSFRLKYGDGTIVEGDKYTDKVTIAGFTADSQTFGSALSYTGPVQNNGYSDGLLGLAFPSLSTFGADPLFESLLSNGGLLNPTFSFKLSSAGAEMYIGGANSLLYQGTITYTPITNVGYWQISIDDVRINGNKILENVPAVLDTGANHIFGDWERVSALYGSLGGTLKENKGFGYYYLPCDSFPPLIFTFGTTTIEIPPEVFRLAPVEEGSSNCFGAVVAEPSPTEFWSVGNTFLQGVYSVFDYGTLQIGFAELRPHDVAGSGRA